MRILLFATLSLLSYGASAQVAPLLSTTWHQTCYYNELVPTVTVGGSCGHAFTGCNATAMAQICKYYSYPTTGFGNHYNSLAPTECVDYSVANYDYSLMPNNVTSSNLQVATLMYDLGVAVDMNWSGTNSTSFFSSSVLKEHYAYSPKMYATATFFFSSTAELIAGLKAELDAGRPVYAKGGGHFYLIDGYNLSDQFHMNFGWGETYDGYYDITSVANPAGTFTPSNFIFNIMPLNGDLEAAQDTIFVGPGSSSTELLEFTSLFNWTISSTETWITPALTSGVAGYYANAQGSYLSLPVNNGAERTGYVIISNASETDTVVVVQETSPLTVTPDPITYGETGGVETVSLTYFSWGSWNVSVSESWITPSVTSGTGGASFDLTCNDNSTGPARTAYLVVEAGIYYDSILVTQQAGTASLIMVESHIQIVPNPSTGIFKIMGLTDVSECFVRSISGEVVDIQIRKNNGQATVDLSCFTSGVYFIHVDDSIYRVVKD